MDDIRWFAPNRYCTLPVPALRNAGLSIALDGAAPARLTVAADGVSALQAYRYARSQGAPLLLYLWDLPPWRLDGGRPDPVFDALGRVWRIPRLTGRYPERAGYYSRLRFVARRASLVLSPSTSTATDVRTRFGIVAERVPFCYDSERFTGERAERGVGSGVVLSISRLVPHKNHAVILRAAATLKSHPLVRIIGQGPEAWRLRTLADTLGVHLELKDSWASDQEIVDAYRDADVVVSPSTFEGFGLTPMEGVAMGVPVIASDIPPHREFMGDAVRYFRPDDEATLAREISAALTSPVLPSSRLPVLADLTIEACARRLLPHLERLLGGHR